MFSLNVASRVIHERLLFVIANGSLLCVGFFFSFSKDFSLWQFLG